MQVIAQHCSLEELHSSFRHRDCTRSKRASLSRLQPICTWNAISMQIRFSIRETTNIYTRLSTTRPLGLESYVKKPGRTTRRRLNESSISLTEVKSWPWKLPQWWRPQELQRCRIRRRHGHRCQSAKVEFDSHRSESFKFDSLSRLLPIVKYSINAWYNLGR